MRRWRKWEMSGCRWPQMHTRPATVYANNKHSSGTSSVVHGRVHHLILISTTSGHIDSHRLEIKSSSLNLFLVFGMTSFRNNFFLSLLFIHSTAPWRSIDFRNFDANNRQIYDFDVCLSLWNTINQQIEWDDADEFCDLMKNEQITFGCSYLSRVFL